MSATGCGFSTILTIVNLLLRSTHDEIGYVFLFQTTKEFNCEHRLVRVRKCTSNALHVHIHPNTIILKWTTPRPDQTNYVTLVRINQNVPLLDRVN